MVCTDRQLAQSQRELGFSTRAGVVRQLRPYSGPNDISAVVDYINRELLGVVGPMRNKVNEVYLQVAEMAPSANPLHYFFAESTVNADPTTGRLRLNQAVQNTATVIRVSELNARQISAAAWLDVMQGSATVPLGVVTLTDSADPGRFIRFDLGSMTDNGAYWDLNVTVVESSHTNPFVEGENVSVGFIAGVAAGTIAAAPGVPGIRGVSANLYGGSISDGTLNFSNHTLYTGFSSVVDTQNVLFSLSGSTLRATALVGFGDSLGPFVATELQFRNSNGLSWGVDTTLGLGRVVRVTGSYEARIGAISHVGGNSVTNATRLAFSNASGATWSLSTAASAATVLLSVNDQSIGLVSHVGGNAVSSVTRLAFSNASNVTFSLSTAAGAATLLASVVTSAQQTFIGGIAGGTQTATSGTIVFSNSNDVTFGLSGSTRMTASYLPQMGIVSHVGGNAVSSVTRLAFSNANNVTFSLSTAAGAATLLASVAAAAGGGVAIGAQSGGTATSGTVAFSNTTFGSNITSASLIPNVVFSMDGSSLMQATAIIRVNDNLNATDTGGFIATKIVFNNSNGVTFGAATTTNADGRFVQMTASVAAGAAPTISYHMDLTGNNWAAGVFTTGSMFLGPVNGAQPFPGNLTISTMDILVQGATGSSTQLTGSWAFTLRGGLYTLANSTQLSLINSFLRTTSSTTINSTLSASRNNSFGNLRWLTIHSSLWSSQPVMSAGVQYWLGCVGQTSGQNIISAFGIQQFGIGFAGTVGATNASNSGRLIPFNGIISHSTEAVHASIANTHIHSTQSASNFRLAYQFRGNIVN